MICWFAIFFWAPVFFVSINHIFRFSELLVFPTAICGAIYFFAILSGLIYLTQKFFKEAFYVGLLFFCIGWVSGPFLEPPGDPLDHLANAYATCNQQSKSVSKTNGGLWHYSMNGVVLCASESNNRSPQQTLNKIRLLHSLMVAFLAIGLYTVGKSAALPPFWAGLSVVIVYLFMGTNRISYFNYYSLSDSSSSLLIYWMWIALFFFRLHQKRLHFVMAILSVIVLIPILLVNHVQEAIFLGLICTLYLLIHLFQYIFSLKSERVSWLAISIGIFLVYICPQFENFRDILSRFFIINDWDKNFNLVVYLGPFHLMGKIWAFRVNDTFGLMGFLSIPAAVAIILMARKEVISYKVTIVGILPLLVYCIPLLHYIWLSNCRWLPTHTRYYYRICYASLFGLTITYAIYQIEKKIFNSRQKIVSFLSSLNLLTKKNFPFIKVLTLSVLFILSTIRSGPVYGKMDFLTLDSNPWWPQWRPMLEELNGKAQGKAIYTDGVTGFVLERVFDYKIYEEGPRPRKGYVNLNDLPSGEKYYTLVNLKGFKPSWVPWETRHWRTTLGGTANFYTFKGQKGNIIEQFLENEPVKGIQVF